MDTKKSGEEIIHIKKYGNRRLYSSAETRFITVEEIAEIVRRGQKVRVTDAETDEDITAEMLTQILLENGRAQHFPVEMLEQMIRLNEEAVKSFWSAYLHQSLQMLQNFQSTFQSFNPFLSFMGGALRQPGAAGRQAPAPAPREAGPAPKRAAREPSAPKAARRRKPKRGSK